MQVAEEGLTILKLLTETESFLPHLMAAGVVEAVLSLIERHSSERDVVILVWSTMSCSSFLGS